MAEPKVKFKNYAETYAPTRKVAAGVGIGMPLAIVIGWILSLYEIQMPNEVAVSLGSLLTAIISYIVRDRAPTTNES